MNPIVYKIGVGLIVVFSTSVIATLVGAKWIESAFFDCGNEILSVHESPGRLKKAILFSRDCGATTAVSYHLAILNRKQTFSYDKGRVFFSCEQLEKSAVQWNGDNHLSVQISCGEVYAELDEMHGVLIDYTIDRR